MNSASIARPLLRPAAQRIATVSRPRQAISLRSFHTTQPRRAVHNIQSVEAFKSAITDHHTVLVDCFATWCGPCKAISPILEQQVPSPSQNDLTKGDEGRRGRRLVYEELSESTEGRLNEIHFIKFDVDEFPEIAKQLGISAMPTFIVFENGQPSQKLIGAQPAALKDLARKAASSMPTPNKK